MKNLILLFVCTCIVLFTSCEDNNLTGEIPCGDECLFTIEDVVGTMHKMNCFDTYGIQFDNPTDSEHLYFYVIPDDLPSNFEVQDKKVMVKGICRTNILEPLFADPKFDMNMLFQAELIHIEDSL